MIVVSVKITFNGDTGAGGYVTEMELCDPRAFDTGDAPLVRRPRPRWIIANGGHLATSSDYLTGSAGFVEPGSPTGGMLRADINPLPSETPSVRRRRSAAGPIRSI